jgi:hypothetical protein
VGSNAHRKQKQEEFMIITNHAVIRFAERSGFGTHRMQAAREEFGRVVNRARTIKRWNDERPMVRIADPKWGELTLGVDIVGHDEIISTVKYVKPITASKRRTPRQKTDQRYDGTRMYKHETDDFRSYHF